MIFSVLTFEMLMSGLLMLILHYTLRDSYETIVACNAQMTLPTSVANYYFAFVVVRSFLCIFALCLVVEKGIAHHCCRKFFVFVDVIAVPTIIVLSLLRNNMTGAPKNCLENGLLR